MKIYLLNLIKSILKRLSKDKLHFFIVFAVLISAFFIRVYRVTALLGFYYDQGRDALVIWDLIHKGKIFLIGPTTGLAGVFLGPFYYYLIAPFYFLGRGNPAYPAVFLAILTVMAIFVTYYTAKKYYSKSASLIVLIITSFSFAFFTSSRWLSNPTPIYLSGSLFLLSLLLFLSVKKTGWLYFAGITAGISLHFEAASAIFYIPILLFFILWVRVKKDKIKLSVKDIATTGVLYLAMQLPQIVFNFRHEGILFQGFYNAFFSKTSFSFSFWHVLNSRLDFFRQVFSDKIFPNNYPYSIILVAVIVVLILINYKKIKLNDNFKVLLIFIGLPLVGFIFFQGNEGNIYDYYLTGFFFAFVLLLSVLLSWIWINKPGKIFIVIFMTLFLYRNLPLIKGYLSDTLDGPSSIKLGNQLLITDWIYKDANGEKFNIDSYVPPVIPYAYDYLFLWQGTKQCGTALCGQIKDSRVNLLYTIYENDPPHPERLEAWLIRQSKIGKVEKVYKTGGITVQRRSRI